VLTFSAPGFYDEFERKQCCRIGLSRMLLAVGMGFPPFFPRFILLPFLP